MRRRLSALVLLFAATSASAAPTGWTEVRSPHFVVYTNSGEKDGRRVAGQFERMRSVFQTLLPGANNDNDPPIAVLALKDKKSFQSIEPESYLAKGSLDLAGLFLRTPDKNYILLRLDTEGEHPYSTVYHEYTHFLLRKSDSYLPLWLNEGLAQFYENTEIENKEVRLGQPNANEIYYLREQRLLPLTTLLAVDHNSPYYHEEQKGSAFYAESWALTHYLIFTDRQNNTQRLSTYNRLLQQFEDPVTAAQHAFGDLKKMEQALNNYINGASFMQFRMNSGFALDDSAFQTHPLAGMESDAVRADVMIGTQRTREAEALLAAILRDEPKNVTAHEVMGNMRLRVHDLDGARKWYREAVELGSQNYMTNFQYANLSLQSGNRDHDEAIESSLRAAIKLNPHFAPSYDTLATFLMIRDRELDEAHMMNLKAVQIEPTNIHYRMNAAAVLQRNNQPESAIGVLKTAMKVARNDGERTMLQNRIASIERHRDSQIAAVENPPHTLQTTSGSAGPVIAQESDHITVAPSRGQSEAEARNAARISGLHNSMSERQAARTVVEVSADGKTATVDLTADPDPTAGRITAQGVIRAIRCTGAGLTLTLEAPGKTVALFSNDYSQVPFTSAARPSAIDPCKSSEGMKATVVYTQSEEANSASQIVSVQLTQ